MKSPLNSETLYINLFNKNLEMFKLDESVTWFLWADEEPIITSNLSVTNTITEELTGYYKVVTTFTETGSGYLDINSIVRSQTFTVREGMTSGFGRFNPLYIEFSNFENDFDYIFLDDTNKIYYGFYALASNQKIINDIDRETYSDDDSNEVTIRATSKWGVEFTVIATERMVRMLTKVMACKYITINGVGYYPNDISSDQIEERVGLYTATLSLYKDEDDDIEEIDTTLQSNGGYVLSTESGEIVN